VEQCGNGARCFVRYVHDQKMTQKNEVLVETAKGLITLKLEANGQVTVNMGAPRFAPDEIPFLAASEAISYDLQVAGERVVISALSMGNPHAVQVVEDTEKAPVGTQGPLIEAHSQFPQRVNAGFMQIIDRTHIQLRVYERGSGETLACGSGACAAVVAGIRLGLLDQQVRVTMRGGELHIQWAGDGTPVWMTGPAESVFEGTLEIDKLCK
jgi:diaminopimelate epimerase